MGGTNHCNGELEIKRQGEWRIANDRNWNLKASAVVCRQLDCGSAVSLNWTSGMLSSGMFSEWTIESSCNGSESSLRDCIKTESRYSMSYTDNALEVICSGKTK